MKQYIPNITGNLRSYMIKVPEVIREASGVVVFGRKIKSLAFTTDISIIENINADAIWAVYPFTPQPTINHAIMTSSDVPVFCGVGGGVTSGQRSSNLALHAEFQGAIGVVLNAPTPNDTVKLMKELIDIPVTVTVVSSNLKKLEERLAAGVDILNVAAGKDTAKIVAEIRKHFEQVPIFATGGADEENIKRTIDAGANAIIYNPPSTLEIFRSRMEIYRREY
ncbi:response regulator receiver protein [Alkaliphilus metalliredigens QYMF]|uniref:Response regulator receiver protein n=1 Tax=Alkaliphilus metalliredigens (strain QYMF) TaxID=293826 RepID=A6TT11_ALKMQ|nr:hydrolase [Alkaliphilus metalliredigens]ABR49329.1 response regulator receiver protein [Alkaliphilus metalliredigens QYMF]